MGDHLSHLIGPKIRVALDNRNSWWRGSGAGVAEFFVIVREIAIPDAWNQP